LRAISWSRYGFTCGNVSADDNTQAAKVIYHGPAAMDSSDGGTGSGKDGNAEQVGLKTSTPHLIAYIVVQVCRLLTVLLPDADLATGSLRAVQRLDVQPH
jgi:hypothetical protein